MKYFSTRDTANFVDFKTATLTGLAPDGGLYIPETLPQLRSTVLSSLGTMAYQDLAYELIKPFVEDNIPDSVLADLVQSAYPFGAPVIPVSDRLVLELFHGPTAAFKDFGARFMARAFSYLRRGEDKPLHILVATSGDTGGAVADGFFGVPGISVTILYPLGRVSPLQERQIAGLGGNVAALAVEGSFDDCQSLVKAAFSDKALGQRLTLSSANSINVSRLIPQAVYYAAAAGRIALGSVDMDAEATPRITGAPQATFSYSSKRPGKAVICVPSGNFGNLTAGLYAKAMGAPIDRFIAATNINKTVPDYLQQGIYEPQPSKTTISNAMDVGAPSNFERMTAQWSLGELRSFISGVWVSDDDTRKTIKEVMDKSGYALDPHGAVGWCAVNRLREASLLPALPCTILATAHPAKFAEVVEPLIGSIPMPKVLSAAMERRVESKRIPPSLDALMAEL